MDPISGVSSVRLEGDRLRALALLPEGRLLLEKVKAIKTRSGAETFAMSRAVGEDAYIYVLSAGGQNIINISVDPIVVDKVYELPPGPVLYPNFLSGIVWDGYIKRRKRVNDLGVEVDPEYIELASFSPTPICAAMQQLSMGPQRSQRLAVEPDATMFEWVQPRESPHLFSQYVAPRSSQWSGKMKKVVQVVFGLGKININTMRDPDPAKRTPKTKFMEKVEANGVQVKFDYKFMRCHGIYTAPDGVLWLIEISAARGVVAVQLPIFPESRTEKFKDKAGDDTAMLTALEELGCLPTGEAFPIGEAYKEAVAAGTVLVLMTPSQLSPFYGQLSGYSSVCGWSFSMDGREAHNVGYGYPEDQPHQKGYWYQINISIGKLLEDPEEGGPIAIGSASLVLQSEGYLWSPPTKGSHMPIKYHEPLIGGLLSHSAKPLWPSSTPNSDTVIFVSIMNGELKTARYFKRAGAKQNNSRVDETDGEECLVDGTWRWRTSTGSAALPTMPYTNDIDPRAVAEEHVSEGMLVSTPLGFDPPSYSDFLNAPEACSVTRSKIFQQSYTFEERGGEYRGACFVAPGLVRDAYYYFQGHSFSGGRKGGTSVMYEPVADAYVYFGWRKFPRIASPGYPPHCETDVCGGKHSERRVICFEYGTGGCSSFADDGPWLEECDDIEAACSGKPPTRIPRSTSWDKGSDFKGSWHFLSDGLAVPDKGDITSNQFEYAMSPSPDPETDLIQNIGATHSAIGEDCVLYQQGFQGPVKMYGNAVGSLGADITGLPTFIGVNG